MEKSGSLLTARIPAVPTTSTQQPVDITEEPNPLELSKEALARRPSFRYIQLSLIHIMDSCVRACVHACIGVRTCV